MTLYAARRISRIQFKKTNTRSLLPAKRWLDYLLSDAFYARFKRLFQQGKRIGRVTQEAQRIIEEIVYIPEFEGQTYKRSYALLRSFIAEAGVSDNASIVLYSDLNNPRGNSTAWNPEGSPLAVTGASKGRFSYAAFFEKPEEFKSFIPQDREPHRPFMGILISFISTYLSQEAETVMRAAIAHKMPRAKK